MVLAQHGAKVAVAGKRHSRNVVHRAEKIIIKMIRLLFCVSDSPIIMIRPSGLLLVVSHLFAVLVSVVWLGLQITK
jgi:hypothetical protein